MNARTRLVMSAVVIVGIGLLAMDQRRCGQSGTTHGEGIGDFRHACRVDL